MKVWKTRVLDGGPVGIQPGKIYEVCKEGIKVATGDGLIEIIELQFDSGKRMNTELYLVGHKIDEGEILG